MFSVLCINVLGVRKGLCFQFFVEWLYLEAARLDQTLEIHIIYYFDRD